MLLCANLYAKMSKLKLIVNFGVPLITVKREYIVNLYPKISSYFCTVTFKFFGLSSWPCHKTTRTKKWTGFKYIFFSKLTNYLLTHIQFNKKMYLSHLLWLLPSPPIHLGPVTTKKLALSYNYMYLCLHVY